MYRKERAEMRRQTHVKLWEKRGKNNARQNGESLYSWMMKNRDKRGRNNDHGEDTFNDDTEDELRELVENDNSDDDQPGHTPKQKEENHVTQAPETRTIKEMKEITQTTEPGAAPPRTMSKKRDGDVPKGTTMYDERNLQQPSYSPALQKPRQKSQMKSVVTNEDHDKTDTTKTPAQVTSNSTLERDFDNGFKQKDAMRDTYPELSKRRRKDNATAAFGEDKKNDDKFLKTQKQENIGYKNASVEDIKNEDGSQQSQGKEQKLESKNISVNDIRKGDRLLESRKEAQRRETKNTSVDVIRKEHGLSESGKSEENFRSKIASVKDSKKEHNFQQSPRKHRPKATSAARESVDNIERRKSGLVSPAAINDKSNTRVENKKERKESVTRADRVITHPPSTSYASNNDQSKTKGYHNKGKNKDTECERSATQTDSVKKESVEKQRQQKVEEQKAFSATKQDSKPKPVMMPRAAFPTPILKWRMKEMNQSEFAKTIADLDKMADLQLESIISGRNDDVKNTVGSDKLKDLKDQVNQFLVS